MLKSFKWDVVGPVVNKCSRISVLEVSQGGNEEQPSVESVLAGLYYASLCFHMFQRNVMQSWATRRRLLGTLGVRGE